MNVSTLACLCLALLSAAASAEKPKQVEPPFGLKWHAKKERLEKLIARGGGTIAQRGAAPDGTEEWTVEGLKQPSLHQTVFSLRDGGLVSIELRYRDESWDPFAYEDFMRGARRRLEQKYGPATEVARSKAPSRGVLQSVLGFQWDVGRDSIKLFYFAAQDPKNTFRVVSLHYLAETAAKQP